MKLCEEMLEKIDAYMTSELSKLAGYRDNNERMAEYRIEHSKRVAQIGKTIAQKEGFDVCKTVVGCLLHDIAYSKYYEDTNDYCNHGRDGAKIARPFIRSLGFSAGDTEEICFGIAIHVDDKSDFEFERTPLALTIGDADNIDRFDAFRLYEGIAIADYKNLSLAEQKEFCKNRILRLEKLKNMTFGTNTAKEMFCEKCDYQIEFLKRLLSQADKSTIFGLAD